MDLIYQRFVDLSELKSVNAPENNQITVNVGHSEKYDDKFELEKEYKAIKMRKLRENASKSLP